MRFYRLDTHTNGIEGVWQITKKNTHQNDATYTDFVVVVEHTDPKIDRINTEKTRLFVTIPTADK